MYFLKKGFCQCPLIGDWREKLTQYQILAEERMKGRKEFSHNTESFIEKQKVDMADKFYNSVSETIKTSRLDKSTKDKYHKYLKQLVTRTWD